ncbi:helicase-related protein [Kitasatospora sp. NPDC008115]|uniref:helicase-related protein n=1 Tax=Kitasatospora sp. NPDC008115 TaxID=3364022 RepID=UPI0036F0702E
MGALDEPLTKLVGDRTAKVLADSLKLRTVGDLLHHYPRRYVERGQLTSLDELEIDEHVTVLARIEKVTLIPFRGRKGDRLEVVVTDGRSRLSLVFFNQGWRQKELRPGTQGLFAGKVGLFNRTRQLASPDYQLLDDADGDSAAAQFAGRLIPVYPASAQMPSWKLSLCVETALTKHLSDVGEPLPAELRERHGLIPLPEALELIHRPRGQADRERAQERLRWDEAFVLQVALAQRRAADSALPAKPREARPGGLLDAFDARLPFTLTDGQRKVSAEIAADLASDHPMHRLLQGEVGSGKAQPLDSLVLTPDGFKAMGSVREGDLVVTPSGELAPVTGVFPQGEREVWRLLLSDGSSVECDDEHLWIVATSCAWHRGEQPKVLTTREIRQDLHKRNGSSKWYLPQAVPVDLGPDGGQPLDPYLMGLLLGDGTFRHQLGFSTADAEIRDAVAAAVPAECVVVPSSSRPYDYGINLAGPRGGTRRNPVIQALRDFGLWGLTSHDKFVPTGYLNAPVKQRLAVLQGLLDTDGTVGRGGCDVSFCSASRRLADDVAWLVRSLGGRARVRPKKAAFEVSVALPAGHPPFRLARKAERVAERPKYNTFRRGIRQIEYVGRKPVQCISVGHPDAAYVTDNFTVTHNTLVALRAMLAVVDAGGQAVLLAPTEVLAQQHHRSIVEMMGDLAEGGMLGGADLATRVVLLTGSMGVPARRQALLDMACGDAGLAIGTHALIEDKVQFQDLGLVVVDEQHRFGVEQRDALRAKGEQPPHLLVMTATPIPRTVAMTVFGDLETSVLDQLPAGRSPISTHVVPAVEKPNFLTRAWERVREEVEKGHQAYVVCPRIGDEEPEEQKGAKGAKRKRRAEDLEELLDDAPDEGAAAEGDRRPPLSVVETAGKLVDGPLAGLRVEILHGRLAPEAKDEVMRRFAAGEVDVLVATTVIEVGVNVPNSTAMVIMDADRFGVSQLHQLRGRVGRGSAPGLCLLVTDMPAASAARARLDAVAGTLDGFQLSRIDLEQRREGDVLGQAQSGVKSSLKVLSVLEDEEVIVTARAEATRLVAEDPDLAAHPDLRTVLESLLDEERAAYMEKG